MKKKLNQAADTVKKMDARAKACGCNTREWHDEPKCCKAPIISRETRGFNEKQLQIALVALEHAVLEREGFQFIFERAQQFERGLAAKYGIPALRRVGDDFLETTKEW